MVESRRLLRGPHGLVIVLGRPAAVDGEAERIRAVGGAADDLADVLLAHDFFPPARIERIRRGEELALERVVVRDGPALDEPRAEAEPELRSEVRVIFVVRGLADVDVDDEDVALCARLMALESVDDAGAYPDAIHVDPDALTFS